jgi:hypothetical protein
VLDSGIPLTGLLKTGGMVFVKQSEGIEFYWDFRKQTDISKQESI